MNWDEEFDKIGTWCIRIVGGICAAMMIFGLVGIWHGHDDGFVCLLLAILPFLGFFLLAYAVEKWPEWEQQAQARRWFEAISRDREEEERKGSIPEIMRRFEERREQLEASLPDGPEREILLIELGEKRDNIIKRKLNEMDS